MSVPEDAPPDCPVCGVSYDSVSEHDAGLMVNLLDNARYRRVCFEPSDRDGVAVVRFYHHTHGQVDGDSDAGSAQATHSTRSGSTAGGSAGDADPVERDAG